jgi:hypothetical protein
MTARWEQIAAMDVEISEREFARDREYFEKMLAIAPAIVAIGPEPTCRSEFLE